MHWPELPQPEALPPRSAPWSGECWAIEAELTPKTVARTTAIMRELLARTGDYGCPAAERACTGHAAAARQGHLRLLARARSAR